MPSVFSTLTSRNSADIALDLGSRRHTSTISDFREKPSLSRTLGAWWQQETIVGDFVSFLQEKPLSLAGTHDPDFNPYGHYWNNREKFRDMDKFIDEGYFDDVYSSEQFISKAESIRREMQRKRIIEQGGVLESILGMGVSLLDPSTFIPVVGLATKARASMTGLKTAGQVAAVVGGEEFIHHQQQKARTQFETVMAIGLSTPVAFGLGWMGSKMSRRGSISHPDNPHNPLHEKNLGPDEPGSEFIIDLDKGVSEQVAENGLGRMTHSVEDGVQFDLFPETVVKKYDEMEASVPGQFDPEFKVTPLRTKAEKAFDWTMGKIKLFTSPTTVAVYTASGKARNLLDSLAEMGVHSEEVLSGKVSRRMTAEMHKDITVLAQQQAAEETMVKAWYSVMKQFGKKFEALEKVKSDFSEVADYFSSGNKIGRNIDPENMKGITLPEFQFYVWRRLMGDVTEHAHPYVEKGIKEAVSGKSGFRKFTDMMFSRAVTTGLLKADQKIKMYFPQIWDTERILANPTELVEAFRTKYQNRFKDKDGASYIDKNGKSSEQRLDEFAHDLVDKLSSRGDNNIPDGFVRDGTFRVGKSNRMDSRELFIDPDELDTFRPFLVTDVSRVMKQYADDMGGRITLREMYGTYKPKAGEEFADLEELANPMKAVKEEFSELKKAAAKKGESTEKLDRDFQLVKEAVKNLKERILNIDRRPGPDGWGPGALFAGRMARRITFLRFMGSVLLSSLTDKATISLSHGLGNHMVQLGRNFGKIANEAKTMNQRELAFLLFGAEGVLSQSRTAKLMGIDDAIYHQGFGTGRTRKISGGIEAVTNWGSSKMNIANLMHYWNSRHKFITGHIILGNILDDAAKGTSKYKWRELGISDDMMRTIRDLTKKHGYEIQKNDVSFKWPDIDKWAEEPGGLEATRALYSALKRSTDRAIITPGIADLPMFHSKEVGQLLLQFNSFGFAAVNKWIRNLRHEAIGGDGIESLQSITWALGMGTLAFSIREGIVKGKFERDEMPDEALTWVYEAIDRSGLMAFTMPYANSMMKLVSGPLADMGVPIEQPSRFSAQMWWQQLIGPSFGTLPWDIGQMGYNLAQGDLEKLGNKGMKLMPYRNVFWSQYLVRKAFGED